VSRHPTRVFEAAADQAPTDLPDSAITDRPWRGKCATTGWTMDDFRERLAYGSQYDEPWPEWVTRAAVAIVRSYGSSITGWCDPAYIANVIHGRYLGVEQ
jgi:hypothetical protein